MKTHLFLSLLHFFTLLWFYSLTLPADLEVAHIPLGWLHHRNSYLTILSFEANMLYLFCRAFSTKPRHHISNLYLFLIKVSLWVAIIYWVLCSIDPDSVHRDDSIHPIMNYTFHGLNLPLLMLPLFLPTESKSTLSSFRSDLLEGVLTMVFYNGIILLFKARFGYEIYPFLEHLRGMSYVLFNVCGVAWFLGTGALLRCLLFKKPLRVEESMKTD